MRLLLSALLMLPCAAFAHHPMIPPVVVAPPVMTAPPVVPAAPAAPASGSPYAPSGGHGPLWVGWAVAGGMVVFAWLAICQLEEERDPAMHERLLCPKTPDWKQCDPFTQQPC